MMFPPIPRLRTTTPNTWPRVVTTRCPAIVSVVAMITCRLRCEWTARSTIASAKYQGDAPGEAHAAPQGNRSRRTDGRGHGAQPALLLRGPWARAGAAT